MKQIRERQRRQKKEDADVSVSSFTVGRRREWTAGGPYRWEKCKICCSWSAVSLRTVSLSDATYCRWAKNKASVPFRGRCLPPLAGGKPVSQDSAQMMSTSSKQNDSKNHVHANDHCVEWKWEITWTTTFCLNLKPRIICRPFVSFPFLCCAVCFSFTFFFPFCWLESCRRTE